MKKGIYVTNLMFEHETTGDVFFHYTSFNKLQEPMKKKKWMISPYQEEYVELSDAEFILNFINSNLEHNINKKPKMFYNYDLHKKLFNIKDIMKDNDIKNLKLSRYKEPSYEEIMTVGLGHCLWD